MPVWRNCWRLAPSARRRWVAKYYFYTRREGNQNQPILYVREGLQGNDRVLVDANNGVRRDNCSRLVVCVGGRQVRRLWNVGERLRDQYAARDRDRHPQLLPDTIERTRAASLAWKLDNSGFYYTRYPKKGEVPAGQEMYYRHVFYHALGTDPARDPLIFGEGRDPEWWPNVSLSEDGRWLLIIELGTAGLKPNCFCRI